MTVTVVTDSSDERADDDSGNNTSITGNLSGSPLRTNLNTKVKQCSLSILNYLNSTTAYFRFLFEIFLCQAGRQLGVNSREIRRVFCRFPDELLRQS